MAKRRKKAPPTPNQEQAVSAIAQESAEKVKKQTVPAEPASHELRLKWSQYIPHHPTPKQLAYLLLPHKEAFFGGGAGGGKSDALLMSALQYVDVPGFSGILFRRTLSELKLPGSLLDRAHSWLYSKPCKFIAGEHTYLFPTQYPNGSPGEPAKLVFGYLGLESAKARYQSAEFHFVGFDEVTHHAESDYLWMFSRIRKVTCSVHKTDPTGKPIYVPGCVECSIKSTAPERMRSASNPGNVGHQWVQSRFRIEPVIDPTNQSVRWIGKNPNAPFIPSLFKDNPYLDQVSYRENLDQLDPLTRAQLQDGNWGASAEARFKANWFRRYSVRGDYYHLGRAGSGPAYFKNDFLRIFATVDPAASSSEGPGDTTNFNRLMQKSHTVIAIWGLTPDYHLLWLDNIRLYVETPDILRALKAAYRQWRYSYAVIEATGLGKAVYQAAMRSGLPVQPVYPHNDKVMRATDAMIRAEQGRIWLPEYPGPAWLKPLEDELFTWTGHPQQADDQIDALSHAANNVSWEASYSDRQEDPDLPEDVMMEVNTPFTHGGIGMDGFSGSYDPLSQW